MPCPLPPTSYSEPITGKNTWSSVGENIDPLTTIPGYEKMAMIDETKQEFTIGGRIFTEPHFPAPSGTPAYKRVPTVVYASV